MRKFTPILIFCCFMLIGCEESSNTVTTGTELLGTLKIYKTCTGGGSISVYQKTAAISTTTSPTAGGTVTLKGSGLKVSMPGCPSIINFQCVSTSWTEAAFGNNVSPNERFTCNSGKVTFSPVSGTQTTLNPANPYPNPQISPTPTATTYQSSTDIPQGGSEIWLIGQGPTKKPSVNGTLQFQITAGRRYVPAFCSTQFICP